jgi:hypothetical protein
MKNHLFAIFMSIPNLAFGAPEFSLDSDAKNFHQAMSIYYHQVYKAPANQEPWRDKAQMHLLENRYFESAGCEKIVSQEYITVFLKTNPQGKISDVYTSSNTEKANCIKKAFTGVQLNKPPIPHSYISMTYVP